MVKFAGFTKIFSTVNFFFYRFKTILKSIIALLTLSQAQLDAFFDSYIIYNHDWVNEEDLIREMGEDYVKQVHKKLIDYYSVLNHLCALGEVEKMYIPPVMDLKKGIIANQNLFERKMCNDLKLNSKSKVLDIGCGRGRVANHVSELTGAHVTGINIDPYQLNSAKAFTKQTGNKCEFRNWDVNSIPFPFEDNSLDAVYQIQVFSLSKNLLALFEEVHRILKPGGRLSCLDWVVLDKYDPKNQEHAELMKRVKPLIGAIGSPSSREYVKLLEKAGFEIIVDEDASIGGHQAPLIDNADVYYGYAKFWVKLLVNWCILPSFVGRLFDRFTLDGQAFVKMDRMGLVTTSYNIVAQKKGNIASN